MKKIRVPPTLHRKVKVLATLRGQTMREWVDQAITRFLAKKVEASPHDRRALDLVEKE